MDKKSNTVQLTITKYSKEKRDKLKEMMRLGGFTNLSAYIKKVLDKHIDDNNPVEF